jgi:hypothetical protein
VGRVRNGAQHLRDSRLLLDEFGHPISQLRSGPSFVDTLVHAEYLGLGVGQHNSSSRVRDSSHDRPNTRQNIQRLLRVCAVRRRRFPVGARPTRQTLQPEAIGAVTEVTKWLKPSECVSRIGDSASVQAVTRVNAEQSSKRTMRRPTRQPFRGRLIRLGEAERSSTPSRCAGVVATACTQGKRTQHGRPQGAVRDDQPDAREG